MFTETCRDHSALAQRNLYLHKENNNNIFIFRFKDTTMDNDGNGKIIITIRRLE